MGVTTIMCRHYSVALVVMLLALVSCGGGGGGGNTPPNAPTGWQRSPSNTLLTPAKDASPATTYDQSIADPSVMYDSTDGLWKSWYSCSIADSAAPANPSQIVLKYAQSTDGVLWTAQVAPVLSSRVTVGDWDYTHVETPSVVLNPDSSAPPSHRYMMFYAGGNRDADTTAGRPLLNGAPYYQIGLAFSADGRSFVRHTPGIGGKPGLVLTYATVLAGIPGLADGLIADPEVVVRGGTLELWCSSLADDASHNPLGFGICLARSTDGITWTTPAQNPLPSLFKPADVAGGQQPAVLFDATQNRYHMWFKNDTAAESALIPTSYFTAYGFWHATSIDGISWTPDYSQRDFPWKNTLDYETYGLLTGCSVVRRSGIDHMFYCSWGTRGIPDTALYQVPLTSGGLVPAVITFNLATHQPAAMAAASAIAIPTGIGFIAAP